MILFGLGNPGTKYRLTRHNAGNIFLAEMAKRYKKKFSTHQGYKITNVIIGNKRIRLIKPICWMNQSGLAIANIMKKEKDDFLIILDDINLPLGRMRLRLKGSDGGHLGLRSIINTLNTADFPRLRIGISNPGYEDAADYVLSPFTPEERRTFLTLIERGIEGIRILIRKGYGPAQNFINSIDLRLIF